MLGVDEKIQRRWAKAQVKEKTREQTQRALAHEILSSTITVEDDAGRDTTNLLAQMGRPMASTEVQRRLKLCNPRLIFVRSPAYPELTGVYIEKDERTAAGGWTKRRIHVCGMESGIMPEFSVRHKMKKRVANPDLLGSDKPTREVDWKYVDTFAQETRGWRTVLLRLLHAELIDRLAVEKHFSWAPSQSSKRWYNATNA
jgi:hypothetical protein